MINDTFFTFIDKHSDDDVSRLILSRQKWPEIDIDLAACTIEGRKRMRKKMPSWYAVSTLLYPTRLCTEQCSSEATASYKATVAKRICGSDEPKIADLTGGLGVDCAAFAALGGCVVYNEMDSKLADAVKHNFQELGLGNIIVHNEVVEPGKVAAILGGFKPELVFMDPARRAADGKKVFLLEDCSPDILKLKGEIFDICPDILLKVSPMADISMLVERLGNIKEVHTVAVDGECKELLLWVQKGWNGGWKLIVNEAGSILTFDGSDKGTPKLAESLEGKFIFEPGKALSKSGVYNQICEVFGVRKLDRMTHLYLADEPSENLSRFGKMFNIIEIVPFSGKAVKEIGKRFPKAEVTAKNIPMTSDELRKRLKCSSGGNIHIFACKACGDNWLIITER